MIMINLIVVLDDKKMNKKMRHLCFKIVRENDIIIGSKCAEFVPLFHILLLLLEHWLFPSLLSISQFTVRGIKWMTTCNTVITC